MSLEEVTQWMEAPDNSEYFYLEEEEVRDGKVQISVGGRFTFWLTLSDLTVTCNDKRAPVVAWASAMEKGSSGSVKEVLGKATKEYTAIADALDALDEEMMDEEDDDDGDYDVPIVAAPTTDESRKSAEEIEKERQFDEMLSTLKTGKGSKAATERILSDYKSVFLSKSRFGWDATPHKGDLYVWDVKLFDFEKGTPLHRDIEELQRKKGRNYIEMTLTFPPDYPFKPPFLRVIRPRFQQRSGRVTIGGSICHELLTNKGWKPINDISSIIETIRAEMTDPTAGARLDFSNDNDYTEAEAIDAFNRMVRTYGWN